MSHHTIDKRAIQVIKKIILLLLLSSYAHAVPGFLEGERVNGLKKYCYYNNGTIITIKSYQLCPLQVSG